MNNSSIEGLTEDTKKRKSKFRYCIVPKCLSTTIKCPDKLFICLPRNPTTRNLWQKAMRREIFLGPKTNKYVCEDHFNLEEDMANYQYYKLMGKGNVNVKIKPGILPHIFHCQKDHTIKPTSSRGAFEKRNRRAYVTEAISTHEKNTTLEEDSENSQSQNDAYFLEPGAFVTATNRDKCVQVDIKTKKKTKSTQCNFKNKNVKGSEVVRISESSSISSSETSSYELPSDESESCNMIIENYNSKESVQKRAVYIIEQNPKVYLGIPPQSIFIIDLICANCQLTKLDIFITLKKLKFDFPYTVLADDFCISTSTISTIIHKSIPKLSSYFQKFVQWKTLAETQKCLPIPFRLRFKKVQCIIDCFETSIQKPSDPILQALTWSEYKKSNTMKYLISCTPDGLISYVSKGFGGRTTDKMIVEESDFLSYLESGAHIMADRGFKHIDEILLKQNNVLVRPPSVSANKKSTKEEVKHAKRVASLRIHVERVISRIREFRLLGPYACVNTNLIKYLDDLVITACGIINIQDYLIK